MQFCKPLLETFRDGAPHSSAKNNILQAMAEALDLDLNQMSGNEKRTFETNVKDAKKFLTKNGLLSQPSKDTCIITALGSEILDENPEIIDDAYLSSRATKDQDNDSIALPPVTPVSEEPVAEEPAPEPEELPEDEDVPTDASDLAPIEEAQEYEDIMPEPEPTYDEEPEEQEIELDAGNIEDVFKKYNADLIDEVLEKVAGIPSDRFEMLVIDLLSKMGYRAFQNARYTNEAEGSDLIHGVILEDKAGMTPIYIQARKLSPSKTVGRSDMQDFIRAIQDKGGKGLFATTANFSEQAVIAANDERVLLIDGQRLASLMVDYNFCVNIEKVFEVKSIDQDSFSEYEM